MKEKAEESNRHAKAVEATAVNAVKKRASEAARQIQEQNQKVLPLFSIDVDAEIQKGFAKQVETVAAVATTADKPFYADEPQLLRDWEQVKENRYDLMTYAGSYRKKALDEVDGKTQDPVPLNRCVAYDAFWDQITKKHFPPNLIV